MRAKSAYGVNMERLKKTERLLRVWLLLLRNPLHFTAGDLAEKFGVSVRTIYRDLLSLDSELRVPVYEEKTKWAIDDSYFLPPIRFTVSEALNIFLAARLMLGYSHRYDPYVDSTFSVLASVMPPPLKDQVQKTLNWMHTLPKDEAHIRVLAKLAEAWTSRRMARITYRSLPAATATERVIEPYFIEPASLGHSSYIVAYCHRAKELRIFKIERIEAIELTGETYIIPVDFDANRYFSAAWGIVVEGEEQTVKLKFNPEIARLLEETIWHPSQALQKSADGFVIMTLRVFYTYELVTWILGWGEKVEVLEPTPLREEIKERSKAMLNVYKKK